MRGGGGGAAACRHVDNFGVITRGREHRSASWRSRSAAAAAPADFAGRLAVEPGGNSHNISLVGGNRRRGRRGRRRSTSPIDASASSIRSQAQLDRHPRAVDRRRRRQWRVLDLAPAGRSLGGNGMATERRRHWRRPAARAAIVNVTNNGAIMTDGAISTASSRSRLAAAAAIGGFSVAGTLSELGRRNVVGRRQRQRRRRRRRRERHEQSASIVVKGAGSVGIDRPVGRRRRRRGRIQRRR